MSSQLSRGFIHGKTIEITDDLYLTDGQEVEVIVRVRAPRPEWGQGILNSAGAMAPFWTAEDDEILAEIARARRIPSNCEIPE